MLIHPLPWPSVAWRTIHPLLFLALPFFPLPCPARRTPRRLSFLVLRKCVKMRGSGIRDHSWSASRKRQRRLRCHTDGSAALPGPHVTQHAHHKVVRRAGPQFVHANLQHRRLHRHGGRPAVGQFLKPLARLRGYGRRRQQHRSHTRAVHTLGSQDTLVDFLRVVTNAVAAAGMK